MVLTNAPTNHSTTFFRQGGGVASLPQTPQADHNLHFPQPHTHSLATTAQFSPVSRPTTSSFPLHQHISLEPLLDMCQPTASHFPPPIHSPAHAGPNELETEPLNSEYEDEGLFDIDDELWDHFTETEYENNHCMPTPCGCHRKPIGSCPKYIEDHINRIWQASKVYGQQPNMDSIRIPLPKPSFPIESWKLAMGSYFDAEELLQAFRFGWDLSFSSPPAPLDAPRNLSTVSIAPHDVDTYIRVELEHGALLGPLNPKKLPFQIYHSPLGLVDKKGSTVRRTIVDASQKGQGINAYIPANWHRGKQWQLKLPNTASIVESIRRVREKYPGQKVLLFKIDMSRWYRWFFLDPNQTRFLAIKWNGMSFIDLVLSFGNRGAALCAQRTSWAICHIFRTQVPPHPGTYNAGVSCHCTHHCECGDNDAQCYIDDVIAAVPECLASLQYEAFLNLANYLGLTLSSTPGHLSPPARQCVALGILFDLEANTVSLPEDKVSAIHTLLDEWLSRETATVRDLASLAGRLLYASRVVYPGRLFLNRVLATKRRASFINEPTILDSAFKADLVWWQSSLTLTNGISFLEFKPEVEVSMDASSDGWFQGLPGLAGFNHATGDYFACPPPSHLLHLGIADLELLCHLIVARLWAHQWAGVQVTGHTDNQATWHLLRRGRSRVDIRLRMARTFATLQLEQKFQWNSAWISTHDNILPDALSRAGSKHYRDVFSNHCVALGLRTRQCRVTPDMFSFDPSSD